MSIESNILSATSSSTLVADVISAYVNWDSAVLFVIPATLCAYAFKKSIDFNKDNKIFFSSIEDKLDKESFQKVVVPLYSAITGNLLEEAYDQAKINSARDKKDFLVKYEEIKKAKLSKVDYTFLDESIEFQKALKEILQSRKNHIDYDGLKTTCRRNIILVTISSFLSLLSAIFIIFTDQVIQVEWLSTILLFTYTAFVIFALVFSYMYWTGKLKLDNLVSI